MQHLTQSKTGHCACNTLPEAACSPAASPSPAVLLYIFLKLDSAPRQSYCCIYIYYPQQLWQFPLPCRRNFVLVHHYVLVHQSRAPLLSCTNLVHLYSRAPISCTSTRVHQSRAPPISCTTRTCAPFVHHSVLMQQSHAPLLSSTNLTHHQSRAPLDLVHNQEAILKFTVCPLRHIHTHSVCPLCANSSICTPTLCAHSVHTQEGILKLASAHSSIRTPTLCAHSVHTQEGILKLAGAHSSICTPTLCAHPLHTQEGILKLAGAHSSIRTSTLCAHSVHTQESILMIAVEMLPSAHVH